MKSDSPNSAALDTDASGSLYEAHKKIYPKAVTGTFATWRWILVWFTQALYYGLCWLPWNGRQAVLFNLVERKFYLFGLVFWPQDVFFLAVLLIISAYALFLFTAVAGRLWCGYACPQTVYTEIFLWIEQKIEGDRNARIKLDAAPMDGAKLSKRVLKYGLWILLSIWTGFTLVGYFTPIKDLAHEAMTLSFGPWEWTWIILYSGLTFGFAGHLREQVCKYMCPYARFQGVMFDPDTLVITYDEERGEPRGTRKKSADYKAAGLGHCVDCDLCVAVCPTGIDIRKGMQYECIGCAACIDVCDQVMAKMDYPKGLIRYSTENALAKHWGMKDIIGHVVRPRIIVYTTILTAISLAWVWGLATKPSLRVDVIRDRMTLAREVEGGVIENVFRLQVMNVSETRQRYSVSVAGLDKIELMGEPVIELPAASNKNVTFQVRVPPESASKGSHTIYFDVKALSDEKTAVHEKAIFLMP
ncbi:MAG TPA: cytochrome c oxidase accessory protein CcoG [Rhodocyclaceae bacterium]|nr:cytochrome c oxidase accessory protein CcoG [Rhodocyclaceae bacterium]